MTARSVFVCQSCSFESPKWVGKCPQCGEWNSLVETVVSTRKAKGKSQKAKVSCETQNLAEVSLSSASRLETGIGEFDRVLGGGFVPGQVILLAGEPGIGKSTLLLQVANEVSVAAAGQLPSSPRLVLYVSGEESPSQVKLRAERLAISGQHLNLLPEADVDIISNQFPVASYQLVIVDSIQTLTTEDLSSPAGSVGQVRECASRLSRAAKERGVPLVLVGHITKSGAVAGPKVLEHLVDTVLYLEGDRFRQFRLLRAFKNRFGSVDEVGVFRMGERGLEEVSNPSDLFLSERRVDASGSAVTAVMEGSRPVLLEVQALTTRSATSQPRRVASGFSYQRLLMLCAVIEKRLGLSLQSQDVYVNVASGARAAEPAADLAVVAAIASAVKDIPTKSQVAVFGEVGLSGEVRSVPQAKRREQEAKKLGFKKVISPESVKTVQEAVAKVGIDS